MEHVFSVAICPPQEIVDEISLLKKELASHIGWFHSKNAAAHITFNKFNADENELTEVKNFLLVFCQQFIPYEISLIKTDFFSNGAFFLVLDDNSKKQTIEVMKHLHDQMPIKANATSIEPHVSIARQLRGKQKDIANELYANKIFNIKFFCDNLAIRMFDNKRKQYFVESRFSFNAKKTL